MAGDANTAGHVYPDQSLYPSNSVPVLVERINNALQRADQARPSTRGCCAICNLAVVITAALVRFLLCF